jgi:hypothetical protein
MLHNTPRVKTTLDLPAGNAEHRLDESPNPGEGSLC